MNVVELKVTDAKENTLYFKAIHLFLNKNFGHFVNFDQSLSYVGSLHFETA